MQSGISYNIKEKLPWHDNTLFDPSTGKPAPEGESGSKPYILLTTYIRQFVKHTKKAITTYVDNNGNQVDGITKDSRIPGVHRTLFAWNLQQKRKEFIAILTAGGNLPIIEWQSKKQPAKTVSKPQTFIDLSTRKRVAKGAPIPKRCLSFEAYLKRFIKQTNESTMIYVDHNGVSIDGITEKANQAGCRTLYGWNLQQKRKEFRAILKQGGTLPPFPVQGTLNQSAIATSPHLVLPEAKAARPSPTELKRDLETTADEWPDDEIPLSATPPNVILAAIDMSTLASRQDPKESGGDTLEMTESEPPLGSDQSRDAAKQAADSGRQWYTRMVFYDLHTGAEIPKGIPNPESCLPFEAYVRRFVRETKESKQTYVDENGKRVDHRTALTLYSYQMRQKRKEFRALLKEGHNLPLIPKDRWPREARSSSCVPSAGEAACTPISNSCIFDSAVFPVLKPSGHAPLPTVPLKTPFSANKHRLFASTTVAAAIHPTEDRAGLNDSNKKRKIVS